jgi:hypothetical protein
MTLKQNDGWDGIQGGELRGNSDEVGQGAMEARARHAHADESMAPRAEQGMAGDEAVRKLSEVIEANRKRWKLIVILEALGLGVSVTLGYLWLVFIIDHTMHLPQAARLASLAVFVACVGWMGLSLVRRWRMFDMTVDQVALAIEKRMPGGLGNRLINALQLARAPGTSGQVARHVVEENLQALERVRLKQARAMRPALLRLGVAGVVVCAGVGMWVLNGAAFNASAARVFDPLGNHDPAYRTRMTVLPGNTQARPGANVTVTISLEGKVPKEVEISQAAGEKRQSHVVMIDPAAVVAGTENKALVQFTLLGLSQTTQYRVIAGDHQSEIYTIKVPRPAQVHGFESRVIAPEYAGVEKKVIQSGSGDLEVLEGSRVEMVVTTAGLPSALKVRHLGEGEGVQKQADVTGKKLEGGKFGLDFVVVNDVAYQIVLSTPEGEQETGRYVMRAVADLPARAELVFEQGLPGLDSGQKFGWRVKASDDMGLAQVGVFARAATGAVGAVAGEVLDVESGGWQMLHAWPVEQGVKQGTYDYKAALAELGFVDGQEVELVPAAGDRKPEREGKWTAGEVVTVTLGGATAALEVEYERILKVEGRLEAHRKAQEGLYQKTLSGRAVFEGDERKDSEVWKAKLAEVTGGLAKEEAAFGREVVMSVRMMPQSAQHMAASLGMINDTDVKAGVQGMERVMRQDGPQKSLAAYNEALGAMSRSQASLAEMHGAFVVFREGWEERNMAGMVRYLADREAALAEESGALMQDAGMDIGRTLAAMKTRQGHIARLTGLVAAGLGGVAERGGRVDEAGAARMPKEVVAAYKAGAVRAASAELSGYFADAGAAIDGRNFLGAKEAQGKAAMYLAQVYQAIKNAHAGGAQVAVVETVAEKQPEGKKLKDGPGEMGVAYQEGFESKDVLVKQKPGDQVAKVHPRGALKTDNYTMTDEEVKKLDAGTGKKKVQDGKLLELGGKPTGDSEFPNQSDREPNQVTATPQETVEDVKGPLVKEEPGLDDGYKTLNLQTNVGLNEPGPVGKKAGDVSSNANAAATGDNQPPKDEVNGTSSDGTKGARSNGNNVGKLAEDRMGLDTPQEGSQKTQRFPGELQRVRVSGKDVKPAVGTGGKRVNGEDRNNYAESGSGDWKTEMSENMVGPQKVDRRVESDKKGSEFDPKALAKMYVDLKGLKPEELKKLRQTAQAVKMIRTIQKEFTKVFMDRIVTADSFGDEELILAALEQISEGSDFRTEARLKGSGAEQSARVALSGGSSFMASPGRKQGVRGRVLDEPAWAVLPGYEGAAEVYFRGLAEGE